MLERDQGSTKKRVSGADAMPMAIAGGGIVNRTLKKQRKKGSKDKRRRG